MKTNIFAKEISLFKVLSDHQSSKHSACQLREFINYLSFCKIKRPYRFDFVEADAFMIKDLSLRENLCLDLSLSNDQIANKHLDLDQLLGESSNKFLQDLYERLPMLDQMPEEIGPSARKLTALFKGLLRKSDYLFLDLPEMHVDRQVWEAFLVALQIKSQNHETKIFVHTAKEVDLSAMAGTLVIKRPGETFQTVSLLSGLRQTDLTLISGQDLESEFEHIAIPGTKRAA